MAGPRPACSALPFSISRRITSTSLIVVGSRPGMPQPMSESTSLPTAFSGLARIAWLGSMLKSASTPSSRRAHATDGFEGAWRTGSDGFVRASTSACAFLSSASTAGRSTAGAARSDTGCHCPSAPQYSRSEGGMGLLAIASTELLGMFEGMGACSKSPSHFVRTMYGP
jgi:hypothetical protein